MGKREPQIILKNRVRSIHLEVKGASENLTAKSSGWDESRVSLRARNARSGSRTTLAAHPSARGPRPAAEPGGSTFPDEE